MVHVHPHMRMSPSHFLWLRSHNNGGKCPVKLYVSFHVDYSICIDFVEHTHMLLNCISYEIMIVSISAHRLF